MGSPVPVHTTSLTVDAIKLFKDGGALREFQILIGAVVASLDVPTWLAQRDGG